MTRFRCTAPGCGVVRSRALPPASCPDKSRCAWEVLPDDAAPATVPPPPPAPPSPPPPPPPPPAPPVAPPAPVSAPAATALVVQIGATRHTLHDSVTLGRNGGLAQELFRADVAVSRQHCRLERSGTQWQLRALSAARTLLNGRLVPPGNAAPLEPGVHQLVLGEAFAVTLELAAPAMQPPQEAGGELDRLLRGGTP